MNEKVWPESDTSSSQDTDELPDKEEKQEIPPDVLHFVDPSIDSVHTLAIRYGVPLGALRQRNALYSDHLLVARKTVLIPGEYYRGGVSLSPQPKDSEEEEIRKGKIRRFQVASKCANYSTAVMYLDQAAYDLDLAVETFLEDEEWEKANPLAKGKQRDSSTLGRLSR